MAGRPLKNLPKQRGDVWDTSIPVRRGAKTRIQATFDSFPTAVAWKADQIARLEAGLDAEPPTLDTPGYRPSRRRAARRAAERLARAAAERSAPVNRRRRLPAATSGASADPDAGPNFLATAERMCREHYELGRHGNPDTAAATRAIISNHLAEIFPGAIPLDAEAGAEGPAAA